MSRSPLVATMLLAAPLLALPALAQPIPPAPPPPEDEARVGAFPCDKGAFLSFPLPTSDPFAPLHLASPSWGRSNVPRNVELVLGGSLFDLDFDPPFVDIALVDDLDRDVPFTREGHVVRPAGLLAADSVYRFITSSAEGCGGCFPEQEFPFTTGQLVDQERPAVINEPLVQAFVLADSEFCGTESVIVAGRIDGLPRDVARVSVAVSHPGGLATRVADIVSDRQPEVYFQVSLDLQVALHDNVHVAVTPIDEAGNVGVARSVRLRVRSFHDAQTTNFLELDRRQCELPDGPHLALPDVIPTNARLRLDLPMEPVPVALTGDEGTFALLPTDHLPSAQIVESIAPLPAGALLDVTTLPCPKCACPGCGLIARGQVRVGDSPDETPPAAPVVLGLVEDLDPPHADGACYPDRTALVLTLAADDADETPTAFLRYDVTVRQEDQLAVEVGRGLSATVLPDGDVAVRLDTVALGRLLPQPLELVIVATDLGGNRTSTTYSHDPAAFSLGGCSASTTGEGTPASLALVALLILGVARRRRR